MRNLNKTRALPLFAALIMAFQPAAIAQPVAAQQDSFLPANGAAYADIADLVTTAPMIVDLQIRKIRKLPESQTMGVPPSIQRALIEADVLSLLRGQRRVASTVKFLLDIPRDSRGRIPKLKKRRYFAMANSVSGRSDAIQLVRPDALIEYSAANNDMVRAITRETVQADAPQAITGVSSAFYSPGAIIGEGETQIFLTTAMGQPVGLSIVSRADEGKRWSVSTSEVISDTDPAPRRNTLLWYRLACGLPKQLQAELVGSGDGANAARAQADYSFVIDALGPCGRTRSRI
ncbi:MAG: hypothetical protein V3V15_06205 [Sphingorhabdus sp.]